MMSMGYRNGGWIGQRVFRGFSCQQQAGAAGAAASAAGGGGGGGGVEGSRCWGRWQQVLVVVVMMWISCWSLGVGFWMC